MDKFLILNADDFGYNACQNAAIKELLTKGLLSSTTILTVADAAEDAASFAAERHLSCGVHLSINSDSEENRWQPLSPAVSLKDGRGLYHDTWKMALKARRRDVRTELEAQYQYLVSRGVNVNHADSHCGTLYGLNGRRFYLDAYALCADHHLPYRFPKSPAFLYRQMGARVPSLVLAMHRHLVRLARQRKVALPDDLITNPWNMKAIQNYERLRDYYLTQLESCPEGVTEVFLHPADPLAKEDQGEWEKRVLEKRLLSSGDLLAKAQSLHLRVVSWDIFKELGSSALY